MEEEVIIDQQKDDDELDEANQTLHQLANGGASEDDWAARVLGWAEDRNLIAGSTPEKQLVKLQEEVDELSVAIADGDLHLARDAIGDCCVVLRIIANQLQLHWDDCQEAAWEEIKDRKGRMVDGIFVKDTAEK